jgi:hypothetical protein
VSYDQNTLVLVLAAHGFTLRAIPNSDHVEILHKGMTYRCGWDAVNLRPVVVQVQDQQAHIILELI